MHAPEDPAPGPADTTRLRIVHLLAWTVGSAIMLAALRHFDATAGLEPQPWRTAGLLFYGLVYGAALAGLLLPFSRYFWGGAAYPRQPGHWLLLTNGVIALVFCGVRAADLLPLSQAVQLTLQALATAPPAAFYLWGAVASRDRARWIILLTMLGSLHVVQSLVLIWLAGSLAARPTGLDVILIDLMGILQTHGTLAAGLLLVLAALLDVTRRETRDWLHWVGSGVELATIVWILLA